jgi:hypothetical protein
MHGRAAAIEEEAFVCSRAAAVEEEVGSSGIDDGDGD